MGCDTPLTLKISLNVGQHFIEQMEGFGKLSTFACTTEQADQKVELSRGIGTGEGAAPQ
jgi:hypothetical protein